MNNTNDIYSGSSNIPIKIAILGNPNCGKTTIFNYLAKQKQKTGNWSGVTTSATSKKITIAGRSIELIDLPGIYSICNNTADDISYQTAPEGNNREKSKSLKEDNADNYTIDSSIDESVTCNFLKQKKVDFIINVIDAIHIKRDLYLTLQLIELGFPLIIVINRIDIAKRKGINIDYASLEKQIKIPVIAVNSKKRSSLNELVEILANNEALVNLTNNHNAIIANHKLKYPDLVEEAIEELKSIINSSLIAKWQILRIIEGDNPATYLTEISKEVQREIDDCLDKYNNTSIKNYDEKLDLIIANAKYENIENITKQLIQVDNNYTEPRISLDNILLHKWLSIPIFILIMQSLFLFTVEIGGFLKTIFEDITQVVLIDGITALLNHITNNSSYVAIFYEGIGNAIKTLVSFVPIIWTLYFGLAFLEESGYMARAAFTMEHLLNKIGLPGKAAIPLIIGFGCNVPSIFSSRTIENRSQRIATILLIPFMSCSARLMVFTLFGSIFFPNNSALVILLLYLIGCVTGLGMIFIFKKYLLNNDNSKNASFILELPEYSWPRLVMMVKAGLNQAKYFIYGVGKNLIIIAVLVNLFSLINFSGKITTKDQSILAKTCHFIIPIFKPMGISENNWPAALSLLTGVLAKEVIVGTLTSLYEIHENPNTGNLNQEGMQPLNFQNWQEGLKSSMGNYAAALLNSEVDDVKANVKSNLVNERIEQEIIKRFSTQANVFAYLLFVLLYFPCVSVFTTIVKEIGIRYALISAISSTSIAYIASVVFYQLSILTSVLELNDKMLINLGLTILITLIICKIIMQLAIGSQKTKEIY